MRILSIKNITIILITLLFSLANLNAQEGEVTIKQDEKIPNLIELRGDIKLDRYFIQIFSGEIDGAQRARINYRRKFDRKWKDDVRYESPNYKVWVGHFKSRLAADRALLKLKEEFPNAFVFKP